MATSGADRSDAGIVSGIANTARMVGGSLGLATLVTVADGRTRALVAGRAQDAASAAEALTAGYSLAFLVSAALLLAAPFTHPTGTTPRSANFRCVEFSELRLARL